MHKIIYTMTDEAPALATHSFFPILQAFTRTANIEMELKDISLAARIISQFPEYLSEDQRLPDALAELGELVFQPEANIIKLPNISASVPQMIQAVKELQSKGYALPNYPENPQNDKEREILSRYNKVKGSAVNPIIRQGNSDRYAPPSVKNYARKHPHSMGEWSADSKTHVSSMSDGDFYSSEQSATISADTKISIVFQSDQGQEGILKSDIKVGRGDIIDSARMSCRELRRFIQQELDSAKSEDILFSIHLKATMMKVSDPIIFGHVLSVYFRRVFQDFADDFASLGVNPNNGLAEILSKIQTLPKDKCAKIQSAIASSLKDGPELAMVNSDIGITNLHVPSDIIIDASMPAAIRSSGKMWSPDGNLKDMKAVIPDRSYSGVYQEVITFCKKRGAFDPATMGSVANIGLMAGKAEEYGSHDKTFEISEKGIIKIVDSLGTILFEQEVDRGDIFRLCHVQSQAVENWIQLALDRALAKPAVFWLDSNRAHDRELIKKVQSYLDEVREKTGKRNQNITILSPSKATRFTLGEIQAGRDIIAVTGNVLRDYLTDLFPILELGTSAKMLSIVPLINGGCLTETGAGGSAPKHVQQFLTEGHLRWDSLGEFLALTLSLKFYGKKFKDPQATILGETLDSAIEKFLENNKSPKRKVQEIDNRGSQFYLTMYWAEALVNQISDTKLAKHFEALYNALLSNEEQILFELNRAQGSKQDIGGYYLPEIDKVTKAMRPSTTFNKVMELV